jgi:predicted HTH domain antitoxin
MQTVNMRQLKNNPSEALREAKQDLVMVMNRDQPTKQKTLSISAAAKFAGKPLGEMLTIVSAAGIPVVDYPPNELDEELANSKKFERH